MYLHAKHWVAQDQAFIPHKPGWGLLQNNRKQPSDLSLMEWDSLAPSANHGRQKRSWVQGKRRAGIQYFLTVHPPLSHWWTSGGRHRDLHWPCSVALLGCSITFSNAVCVQVWDEGWGCFCWVSGTIQFPHVLSFLPQLSTSEGISCGWPEHLKFCSFGHLHSYALG